MSGENTSPLDEYKAIETRFYGEVMKICRRYSNDLNLISLLGILEIVKQEIRDLDRTGRSLTQQDIAGSLNIRTEKEKENLGTLL